MGEGRGVVRMRRVAVCHRVWTTAQRPLPTTSWYQIQVSGWIGSPTVPRTRRLSREYFVTWSLPEQTMALRAVGAV